jgi:hypothetical protein
VALFRVSITVVLISRLEDRAGSESDELAGNDRIDSRRC